ncbi:MAG TPA: hypothetical protein VFR97_13830 [Capillimicrobium sp.]|nr:hypothetical protein [Capillimicrobium sp.]
MGHQQRTGTGMASGLGAARPKLRRLSALPGAAVVAGCVAATGVAAAEVADWEPLDAISDRRLALAWSCAGVVLFGWLLLRRLAHRQRPGFLGPMAVQFYFLLLFLGVASHSLLRLLADRGVPVAATQTFPDDALVGRAFALGLLGGAVFAIGVAVGRTRSGRNRLASDGVVTHDESTIAALKLLVPITFVVGCLGIAIVTASTGRIALFASNIDDLRYSQGSGLGYAALLQFELLSCACIALYVGIVARHGTPMTWAAIPASLMLLVVFRVERTPLILTVAFVAVSLMLAGRTVAWRAIVSWGLALVVLVGGLGVLRLGDGAQQDRRAVAVRPLYDLAPEFREQAFVYDVYPSSHAYLGVSGLAAVASSIVPSGVLALGGIDKQTIYTDISRDYSATMRQLGYYTISKPLRVGVAGELWGLFGPLGLTLGFLGLGIMVSRISAIVPRSHLGRCAMGMAGALTCFAMVTPLAALAPVSLMILLPVAAAALLSPRLANRGV